MAHIEPECPDYLTGSNCTVSWREALKPGSEIVEGVIICQSCVGIILSTHMAIHATRYLKSPDTSKEQKQGAMARLRIIICFLLCNVSLLSFACLGGNLEYQLTDVRGKICIISLLFSIPFFYHGGSYIVVMYISGLNNQLRKGNFIEQMNLPLLRKLAVPWPLYLGSIIASGFVIAERIEFPTHLIRGMWGGTIFYPLMPMVGLLFYYLNKMANFLDEATESLPNQDLVIQFRKIARDSRRTSVWCVCTATPCGVFNLYFTFTDLTHDPDTFFIVQSLSIITSLVSGLVLMFLLRNQSSNSSSSSGKNSSQITNKFSSAGQQSSTHSI